MEKIFQAISSTTRRNILSYLSKASLNAGEIASRFAMTKPTISKHLEILENAGLIKSEKKGQYVYYSLIKEGLLMSMYDFLSDFCPISKRYKKESEKIANKEENHHE